MIVKKTAWTSW